MTDETIDRYRKLADLAADQLVLFDSDSPDDIPRFALMCNDVFAHAADGETFTFEDIDVISDLYHCFDFDGIVAWISYQRNILPFPPLAN